MGLHRDGDRLRLPVFQAELRRRLWWYLLARDSRAAEDYGLQKLCNIRFDADLPLNLDDTDLYPDMAELPAPRLRLTDITFTLIGYHIALALQRLAGIVAASTPPSPPQESVRKEIIGETRTRVEEWLGYCNPVIPRHRLALLSSRLALRKADLISRHQWLALNHPDSHGAFATEEDLVETLEVLELVLQIWNDEMLKPYSWMWRANPEYHVILYLLWHLCVRPEGRNVSRAWNMVGRLFAMDQDIGEWPGARGAVLTALKEQAEAARDSRRCRGSAGTDKESIHPAMPANDKPEEADTWERSEQASEAAEHVSQPDMEEDIPDWGSFFEALQLEGQDFPGML